MTKYLVVSTKNNEGYYREFETREDAEVFLNTEEYDFRERELFDTKKSSDMEQFKKYYCYTPDEDETDEGIEAEGYNWHENLQDYCRLSHQI